MSLISMPYTYPYRSSNKDSLFATSISFSPCLNEQVFEFSMDFLFVNRIISIFIMCLIYRYKFRVDLVMSRVYNKYMRRGVLPNLNKEEKIFWDKNKDFAVVYNKTQLAKLQDISYDKVTTKGTMTWLYEHCGIQPHEFLAKRVDSFSYDPTIEIRFNGADVMAIYRLAI